MTTPVLLSSADAARALGISQRRVQALAHSRGVGQRIAGRLVFTPQDVEAMRSRKPGRPRGAMHKDLP